MLLKGCASQSCRTGSLLINILTLWIRLVWLICTLIVHIGRLTDWNLIIHIESNMIKVNLVIRIGIIGVRVLDVVGTIRDRIFDRGLILGNLLPIFLFYLRTRAHWRILRPWRSIRWFLCNIYFVWESPILRNFKWLLDSFLSFEIYFENEKTGDCKKGYSCASNKSSKTRDNLVWFVKRGHHILHLSSCLIWNSNIGCDCWLCRATLCQSWSGLLIIVTIIIKHGSWVYCYAFLQYAIPFSVPIRLDIYGKFL